MVVNAIWITIWILCGKLKREGIQMYHIKEYFELKNSNEREKRGKIQNWTIELGVAADD